MDSKVWQIFYLNFDFFFFNIRCKLYKVGSLFSVGVSPPGILVMIINKTLLIREEEQGFNRNVLIKQTKQLNKKIPFLSGQGGGGI